MMRRRAQRGFSLVELVIVIVLIGIIAGIFAMQLGPTMQGYLAVGKRAALTDQAETALRRVLTEVRSAVPNSLRLGSAQCLQLVPTSDGGRYRAGPDINVVGEAFLDYDEASTAFDVLTPFSTTPANGDLVVIGNQNPDDIYNRTNVAVVDNAAAPPAATMGTSRITLQTPLRIPFGYTDGRFVVVPGGQQTVSYICDMPASGTGTLYRVVRNIAPTQDCSVPANSPKLATKVESCTIVYSPNQGATQQSGFVQIQLRLLDGGESVSLTLGAHVSNAP